MNKPQILQSFLLAFAIVALLSSPAFATPQVFKRSTDKKADSTATESSTDKPAKKTATTTSSVKKESSAKMTEQSDGWFTITDDVSNAEFRLPGKPTYLERSFSPISGRDARVNHRYVVYPNKESSFEFSWWDLHEAPTGRALNNALDGAVKGTVVNVIGQLDRMDKIRSGSVPGREYDFTFTMNPTGKKDFTYSGRSRVFISGNRRYQLDVLTLQGKEDADATKKLFDSLIIKSE